MIFHYIPKYYIYISHCRTDTLISNSLYKGEYFLLWHQVTTSWNNWNKLLIIQRKYGLRNRAGSWVVFLQCRRLGDYCPQRNGNPSLKTEPFYTVYTAQVTNHFRNKQTKSIISLNVLKIRKKERERGTEYFNAICFYSGLVQHKDVNI